MKKLKLYSTYYIVINKFNNYSLVKSWLELKFTKTNFIILLVLYWNKYWRERERERNVLVVYCWARPTMQLQTLLNNSPPLSLSLSLSETRPKQISLIKNCTSISLSLSDKTRTKRHKARERVCWVLDKSRKNGELQVQGVGVQQEVQDERGGATAGRERSVFQVRRRWGPNVGRSAPPVQGGAPVRGGLHRIWCGAIHTSVSS